MEQVLVILALSGIVSIITRSYIMTKIREKAPTAPLRYMLNCPQCTGFWIGVIYGVYAILNKSTTISNIAFVILVGGLVSLVSSTIIPLLDYLSFAKTVLVNKIADSSQNVGNSNEEETS